MQQRMFRKAAIALAVASLAACTDKPAGLDLTPPSPPPGGASGYVVHAVTDSPNLAVTFTDSAGTPFTSGDLAYGGVLKLGPAAGAATLDTEELLAADNSLSATTVPLISTASTVNPFDVTVQLVTGTHLNPTVLTATANGGAEGYGLGYADVVVADAAPASAGFFPGGVAYYFTDFDASHLLIPPTGTTFGAIIDPFLSAPDPKAAQAALFPTYQSYRMFVVDATNPANVLFDSGLTKLQPPSGGPMILALIDNPDYSATTGNSPFRLFSSMTGAVTSSDQSAAASVARVINATNIGAIDYAIQNVTPKFSRVNGLATGAATTSCSIGVSSDLLPVLPGSKNPFLTTFYAYPSGQAAPPDVSLEATGLALDSSNLLVLPSGDPAGAGTPTAEATLLFKNDSRSVSTEARLRFVNVTRSTVDATNNPTGTVYVYVNPTGRVTDGQITSGGAVRKGSVDYAADPNAAKPFTDVTGATQAYLSLAGNQGYDIRITDNTNAILAEATNVVIPKGASLTEVLVDGAPSPTITTVDNTVAACP